ncbi:hypothetical protein AOLI_G00228370 [Acnodon oligacanthus]
MCVYHLYPTVHAQALLVLVLPCDSFFIRAVSKGETKAGGRQNNAVAGNEERCDESTGLCELVAALG